MLWKVITCTSSIYLCLYVSVCISVGLSISVCLYLCACVCLSNCPSVLCLSIHLFSLAGSNCSHLHDFARAPLFVCVCVCVCLCVCASLPMHVFVNACQCVCVCVCVCVRTGIYSLTRVDVYMRVECLPRHISLSKSQISGTSGTGVAAIGGQIIPRQPESGRAASATRWWLLFTST